jgi:hypothetical protein
VNEQLYLAVREHPYALLFATVSGAHLYGFPSADSDYDLRGTDPEMRGGGNQHSLAQARVLWRERQKTQ